MTAGLVVSFVGDAAITYRAMFAGTAALTLAVLVSLAPLIRESSPETKERDLSAIPLSKLRAALSDAPFMVLLAVGFLLYYVLG